MILTRRRALIGGAATLLLPRPAIIRPARAGLVMAPTSASAGIAYNSSADLGNNSSSGSPVTSSFTVNSGLNLLLVVAVTGDLTTGSDDITTKTYNGTSLTLAIKNTGGAGPNSRFQYIYYLLSPFVGTANIVIGAATAHWIFALAAVYSGVKQSAQPDAVTTNHSTSAVASLTTNITTISNNSLAILAEDHGTHTAVPTAGAGSVLRVIGAAYNEPALFDSGSPITPAGAYSMTTTLSAGTDYIGHAIASFSPA